MFLSLYIVAIFFLNFFSHSMLRDVPLALLVDGRVEEEAQQHGARGPLIVIDTEVFGSVRSKPL